MLTEIFSGAWATICKSFIKTFIREDRYKLFTNGFYVTVTIAVFATLIGVFLGIIVALLKVYHSQTGKLKSVNWLLNIYTTVIRGTPMVVQLLIAYNIIFVSSDNAVLVSVLAFGINSGAYVSEIVRAGIMAVDKGQTEAGRSLGLSHFSTMKNIILPQALKNILPALGNEFITILKETSVAGYIAVTDMTKASELVTSRTLEPYFSLLSVAAVYLILVMGMTSIFQRIERRLSKSDRH